MTSCGPDCLYASGTLVIDSRGYAVHRYCQLAAADPAWIERARRAPGESVVGPPPPPRPTEAELLRGLRCPHQRLCGCSTPGYECLVSGGRKTPAECGVCFYGFRP